MNQTKCIFYSAILMIFCAPALHSQNLTDIYCGHLLNTETGNWLRNALIKVDQGSGRVKELASYTTVSEDNSGSSFGSIGSVLFAWLDRYAYPYF